MFLYRITFILILISAVITIRAQETCQHTVMRGETFASVAKKYGITEAELKDANPGHKTCYVGLRLTVPIVSQPTNDAPATNAGQETQVSRDALSAQAFSAAADNNRASAENTPKKKKSFWKSLGEIASGVGDVVVGVASGLNETGLIDKTGNAGALIGGTADIVNMSRGTQSNFLGAATKGEYDNNADSQNDVNYSSSSANGNDIVGLQNRLTYVDQRLTQINNELASLLKESGKAKAGQIGAAKQSMAKQRKYQNVHNNSVNTRKKALNAGVKAQEPYVNARNSITSRRSKLKEERSALMAERSKLVTKINQLQGISSDMIDSNVESSSSSTKSKGMTKVECDYCKGTGKDPHGSETAVPEYLGDNTVLKKICPYCSNTSPHIHKTCPKCKGKKYIMK